jgi:quinol monooxygenase YgiN
VNDVSPNDPEAAPQGVEVTVVTLQFDSLPEQDAGADRLLGILAKYVVVSRGHLGCRNIDLCASRTQEGRFLVIEKWETPAAQRAHFDSAEMVEMAKACQGLLARRPTIDLLAGISAHDLT